VTYQLGIDLGTTYTAAAVSRASEQQSADPEMVGLGDRAAQVPSVLYLGADGSLLVGDAAERRAVTDPGRVVREFKRQIGDETPIVIDGTPHPTHELAASLVRWVVERVEQREGGPALRIALTHPASWGAHKKDLLAAALATRGLTVTFLAEPQAAALSYAAAERIEPGSTIAVYDLGGGTFDAAVVRKNGTFAVLGRPEGIDRLGGVDFDDAVFAHVREAVGEAFDALDPTDEAVLAGVARLRRECTEAKEALSADTEVQIPVLLPGLQTAVRMVRGEFEAVIRPQLEDTVDALHRAVASAGLTSADLTAVLLVGGSSRIPLISQLVSAEFDTRIAVDADPKNAIALGAALAISPRPQPRPQAPPVAHPPTPPAGVNPVPPAPAPALATPARPAMHPVAPPTLVAESDGGDGRPDRRRPVGLMFGAGGLFVAAALVAALLFAPGREDPLPAVGTVTSEAEVPPAPADQITDVVPAPAAEQDTGGGQRQAPGGGRAPAAPGPAPATAGPPPERDNDPPRTSAPATEPTTEPTTDPTTEPTTEPTTDPPPPDPGGDSGGTGQDAGAGDPPPDPGAASGATDPGVQESHFQGRAGPERGFPELPGSARGARQARAAARGTGAARPGTTGSRPW
jgi:molecular chaperone DnaK